MGTRDAGARPGGLATRQDPPLRTLLLQRADRRPARGVASRVRAFLLVRARSTTGRSPRSTSGSQPVRRSTFSIRWPRLKRSPSFRLWEHCGATIKLGLRGPADVSLRLALDPGFESDRLHAIALRDETLVREPATSARWPAGRNGGRPGRRVARLGARALARRSLGRAARTFRRAGVGADPRPPARLVLGRRRPQVQSG